jgi:hypothetical protein
MNKILILNVNPIMLLKRNAQAIRQVEQSCPLAHVAISLGSRLSLLLAI